MIFSSFLDTFLMNIKINLFLRLIMPVVFSTEQSCNNFKCCKSYFRKCYDLTTKNDVRLVLNK